MEETGTLERFSLLGGPLHRLGSRLGLVRGNGDTLRLGLALGFLLWFVMVALATLEGLTPQIFSLGLAGLHVRLLVVIPLFFLCEGLVDPQWRGFVSLVVESGIVPENGLPALESAVATATRRKDSWLAEAVCLLAAVLLPWITGQTALAGVPGLQALTHSGADNAVAGWWFWMVCLPLFRFLMLRWIWRLGLWWHFLWKVARMDLNLVPSHPDGVAGLGHLELVHTLFSPLVLSISLLPSAMVADGIATGSLTFEALAPSLAWILLLDFALFVLPLFVFTPKLWACRDRGLRDYSALASHYVNAFDRKWVGVGTSPGEPLLGSPDIQSLADLYSSVTMVRNLRWAPVSLRMFAALVAAALLPLVPLLLLQYPAGDLARRVLMSVVGL